MLRHAPSALYKAELCSVSQLYRAVRDAPRRGLWLPELRRPVSPWFPAARRVPRAEEERRRRGGNSSMLLLLLSGILFAFLFVFWKSRFSIFSGFCYSLRLFAAFTLVPTIFIRGIWAFTNNSGQNVGFLVMWKVASDFRSSVILLGKNQGPSIDLLDCSRNVSQRCDILILNSYSHIYIYIYIFSLCLGRAYF